MKVGDFDYALPPEQIAQHPVAPRDNSRLMVLNAKSGAIDHRRFHELPRLLRSPDLLVVNDTRVVPARLIGRKPTGGRVELLLLERVGPPEEDATWRCMLGASRKPEPGARIELGEELSARLVRREDEHWIVRLESPDGRPEDRLERVGRMPLPPYIKREDGDDATEDRERYQTIYARAPGAIAAPTAGLHFTRRLLDGLERAGIARGTLTLHVGPGTFLPVRTAIVAEHTMHAERFEISQELAREVDAARERGGRVVAVGTTVVRALESCATEDRRVEPRSGSCSLFIYPGFRFRAVDAMITNFHLPRSTLLMLVCAFAGREQVLAAYREAVREDYRFYSYGDAMLIVQD